MEWKRVFCSKKRMGALLLLTILCGAVFVYDSAGGFSIGELRAAIHTGEYAKDLANRLQTEENISDPIARELERLWCEAEIDLRKIDAAENLQRQAAHIAGYSAFLRGIETQAKTMSQAAIFQKNGSFSNRNLEKTVRDFRPLAGITLTFDNSLALETWLQNRSCDFFFIVGLSLFVFALLEERKKGLLQVIRSCRKGRNPLALQRLGILAEASILCAALFQGLPLVLSASLNGGLGSLSRPVQSIAAFGVCPLRLTAGEWLMRYFLLRAGFGFVLAVLLWVLLSAFDSIPFPLTILGVTAGVELGFYYGIPEQSILSPLKYCNLISLVDLSSFDTAYCNLNFFGFPVGKQRAVLLLAALLLAGSIFFLLQNRYSYSSSPWFDKLTGLLRKAMGFLHSRFPLGLWEADKSLRFSFGAMLLAAAVVTALNTDYLVRSPADPDAEYAAYRADLLGELTDSDLYFARANADSPALQRLRGEVDSIKETAESGSYAPWLVDQAAFDGIYGLYSIRQQRLRFLLSMLFITALCAGIGAFEGQSGVVYLLKSTRYGRKRLRRCKLALAAVYAFAVWAVVSGCEFATYMGASACNALAAPVQNFGVSIPVTLGGYLTMLYALRLVMLVAISWLAFGIGSRCKTLANAYLWSAALLVLPAGLTVIGFEICKWFSLLVPVTATEVLQKIVPIFMLI